MSSSHTPGSQASKNIRNTSGSDNAKDDQKCEETKVNEHLFRSHLRLDKFLSPSTKVKDILSEAEKGRPLRNRRILTLISSERSQKVPQVTPTEIRQSEKPDPCKTNPRCVGGQTPSIWLLASRWAFLPKTKPELKDQYNCPKYVKKKLEEDIAKIKKEVIKELTNDELFEFYEYLNKLASGAQKTKSSRSSQTSNLNFSYNFAKIRIRSIPHLLRGLVPKSIESLINWIKSKYNHRTSFHSRV